MTDPSEFYGSVKEGVHVAGYSLERAWRELEKLLEGDGWRHAGPGFSDVNRFIESIKLDQFKFLAEQRKRLAKRIKELQPDASNRAIAKLIGVAGRTIDRDATNVALEDEKTQLDQLTGATNVAQAVDRVAGEVSGAEAAQAVERAAQSSARKERREQHKHDVSAAAFSDDGPFDVVVIDPPWAIQKIDRDVRPNQVEFDYPTMTIEEIIAHWHKEVAPRLKENVHVFMWTTQKWLPPAIEMLPALVLRYVLVMAWHKAGGFQPIGLPQYNCEFVVYARRGTPLFIDTKEFNCCFEAPRREHSRKPDEFYNTIRRVTGGSRIDVFSREPREGFAQLGNEASKFAEAI